MKSWSSITSNYTCNSDESKGFINRARPIKRRWNGYYTWTNKSSSSRTTPGFLWSISRSHNSTSLKRYSASSITRTSSKKILSLFLRQVTYMTANFARVFFSISISDTFVTKSIQKFRGKKNSFASLFIYLFSSPSDSFFPRTPLEFPGSGQEKIRKLTKGKK